MKKVKVLALSGSLRNKSYNSALLYAAAELSPAGINISVFNEMENIPLFNPDKEGESILAVSNLLNKIEKSDGLIISSPEYAHGISGVLKNTLDWLVSSEQFPYTPVMLFNTSPRATHAQAALREVISTMSGNIIEEACESFPLLGTDLDSKGIIEDRILSKMLISRLTCFRDEIQNLNQ